MTLATLGVADSGYIDAFFSSNTSYSQPQLDSLANNALSQGIDFYQKGDYDKAINAFKKSAGLSPGSDNTAKAYNYMAQSYLQLDKTDQAISTYKYAIGIFPNRDDLHLALGDIYAKEGNQDAALKEYEAAVRFDPNSTQNRYSLGQSYLSSGQLDAARVQFQAVAKLSPNSATGYFGLGQVARAAGDFQEAVLQFKKAISVNRNFLNSYRDLGYAYADMGDFQRANEQYSFLKIQNSAEATNLQDYISQVAAPKITAVLPLNGFDTRLGPGTSVSDLNANLATPGNSKIFSMKFAFSKDMDENSITNPYNWKISRATIQDNRGVYNGGKTVPQTEASILPNPINIIYDGATDIATIKFRIAQNATSNATIDPNHIVFKFSGQDAYGKAMDLSADEYSGFFANEYNGFFAIA
jgi:tetratricopeptide (TPR) repeat protein